jgi:putative Mg2+ transporter-C (MgtC) family protein
MGWLHTEFLIKVIIATVCGGVLGFERKIRQKHMGMKTNYLICLGSMLFAHLGLSLVTAVGSGDATRVIGQIVTGVGFLGAGAIMRESDGHVTGLTSAALVWVNAAIGSAIGVRYYQEAVILTAIIVVTLPLLQNIERKHAGPKVFKDGG